MPSSRTQLLAGRVAGLSLIPALFYPILIFAPIFIVLFSTATRVSQKRLLLVGFVALILFSIFAKDFFLIGTVGYSMLVAVFPVAILGVLVVKKIHSEFINGVRFGVDIIFLLDFTFNIWAMIFGVDIFGRPVVIRDDGVRIGGLLGHSFYSVSISLVYIIANAYEKKNFLKLLAGAFNIYFAGAFRGIIHLGFIVIFLLIRISWVKQFFVIIMGVFAVILATIFSVQGGYLSENSGNAYRLFAWSNAINLIEKSPILGSSYSFETWQIDTDVTEDSISETGTTESMFLGDAVRYGLILASIKVVLLLYLASIFSKINSQKYSNVNIYILRYIPMLLLLDYFLLSLWGSVYLSFYLAVLCAHGITLVENVNQLSSRALLVRAFQD